MKQTLIAIVSSLVLGLLCSQFAMAEETKQDCNKLKEKVSIDIRFNGVLDSAAKAQEKINEVENNFINLARELGMLEIKPNGQNFSLSSTQNHGTGYQYNGSMAYTVTPYKTAVKLVEKLTASGHQVSLRVSRTPYPGCY